MRLAIKLLAGVGGVVIALPLLMLGLLAAAGTGALDGPIKAGFQLGAHRTLGFRRLELHLLQARPTIVFDDLDLGSPPAITQDRLAHVGHGEIAVKFWPLLAGRLVMTDIALTDLDLRLVRLAPGRNNYSFGGAGLSAALHDVTHLVIGRATVSYLDPERQLTLKAQARYDSAAGDWPLTLKGGGVDHGGDYTADAQGGRLTGRNPSQPYAFMARLDDGDLHAALSGTSVKPFDFRGFDAALDASGPNLAALGYLFGVSAPNSTPFTLKTRATRKDHVIAFTDLKGRFGSSEVTGDFRSDHSRPRRTIALRLSSPDLHAPDVAAFFAARPGHAEARLVSGARPTRPTGTAIDHRGIDLAKLRTFDAAADLTAARVEGYPVLMTNFRAHLALKDGRLVLQPLQASAGSGTLSVKAVVEDLPGRLVGRIDAALLGARLGALAPAAAQSVDGELDATAHLSSTGPTPDALPARAAGRIAVRLRAGRMKRNAAAALAGDPLQAAWTSLTGGPDEVALSCVRAGFDLGGGVLTPSLLRIDTGEGDASGRGSIDLKSHQIDLTITPGSAARRPVLKAPVHIHGDLLHPKADVAVGAAAGRSPLGFLGALITTPFRGPAAASAAPCPPPG